MRRFVSFGPAFVVLVTALVTLVAAPAAVRRITYAGTDARIQSARASLEEDTVLERINDAVRAIADAVEPTIVHIVADGQRYEGASQGSGWVYDTDGHIVTNAHVVAGADRIRVQFHDGRLATADLVGLDLTTDIAVLRARTTEGLFPSARATGQELRQGDRVYAFGSPFGFKFSMSEGIVSGLGRDPRAVIQSAGQGYTNFIQTDAAVNPGNSGGPLVDVNGRVVGMNVAIATGASTDGAVEEGQSSGISFAIPLVTIESVVNQIIARGIVEKGFLGIRHSQTDEENRRRLNDLDFIGPGVVVIGVPEGGPAGGAGLRAGDVITEIGGMRVTGLPALRSLIANHRPGEPIEIGYWREGDEQHCRVVLADLLRSEAGFEQMENALAIFGLTVVQTQDGVRIAQTVQNSSAFRAGLRAQQFITHVGDRKITDEHELAEALYAAGFLNGRGVDVTLREDETSRRVNLRITE